MYSLPSCSTIGEQNDHQLSRAQKLALPMLARILLSLFVCRMEYGIRSGRVTVDSLIVLIIRKNPCALYCN